MNLKHKAILVNWFNGPTLWPRIRLTATLGRAPGWNAEHAFRILVAGGPNQASGPAALAGDVPFRGRPGVLRALAEPTVMALEEVRRLETQLFGARHRLPGTPLRLNRVSWREIDQTVNLSLLGPGMVDGELVLVFRPGVEPDVMFNWGTPRNEDPETRARMAALARPMRPVIDAYRTRTAGLFPSQLPDLPGR